VGINSKAELPEETTEERRDNVDGACQDLE
jgi:hypothetical protein